MRHCQQFAGVMLLAACCLLCAAPSLRSEPPAPAEVASDLLQWVRQLSSDSFLERELAVQQLRSAGPKAVPAIRSALDRNDTEASVRAIAVLQRIAVADEVVAEGMATELLDELSRGNSPAAHQARAELARLAQRRQTYALEQLEKHGMVAHSAVFGDGISQIYRVEFNDQWRGELKDIAQLQWIKTIQQVDITYPKADDQWMKFIARLPQLTYLSIRRTHITDAGIRQLQATQPIQYLDLKYMELTDDVMQHFKTLAGLNRLRIFGTQVTIDGAKQLAKELPTATIDRRDGGFLGVSCESHPLGCVITLVNEGTAAANCGIEIDDVVIEYDGHSVADFDRLTTWISHNKPGDEVRILFARKVGIYQYKLPVGKKTSELEVKPHKVGLQVAKVAAGSPFLSQVREGDIIFRIDDLRVRSVKELDAAMSMLGENEEATIYVARGGEFFDRVAKLGEWE